MAAPPLSLLRSVELPAPGQDAQASVGRGSSDVEAAHADFHAKLADLSRAVCARDFGVPELATTAEVRRAQWAADRIRTHEAALLMRGERVLGAWTLSAPVTDNLTTADLEVLLADATEGAGGAEAVGATDGAATDGAGGAEAVGATDSAATERADGADPESVFEALLEDSRARASALGRSILYLFQAHPQVSASGADPGLVFGAGEPVAAERRPCFEIASEGTDMLDMRSGAGGVARDDAAARRLMSAGFAPVQLERFSVLATAGADPVLPPAPSGFAFAQWEGRTPADREQELADLYTVFERTVPSGGAAYEPEVWDSARLRDAESAAEAAGITRVVTALVDAEGAGLVGFTFFEHTAGVPVAFQDITVVRPEFRGRGLAVALKRANTAFLRSLRPEAAAVCTWNAAENAPMLAVNNAAGFVPQAFTVVWEAGGS